MFFKKKKREAWAWTVNLAGLIINFFAAILIFYSVGAHPCTQSKAPACGGVTGGLYFAYIKSPLAAKWGLFLLIVGFTIQLIACLISKKHK